MNIDTIKKGDRESNNTLDLKSKTKRIEKKPFKLTYLKVILKDKKDIVFYISLFLIMGLIIFFWILNLKNYSKDFEKISKEGKGKYQEVMSAYELIKNDMNSSLSSIKENLESMKNNKQKAATGDTTKKEETNNLQEKLLLDSLTEEQKQQITDSINKESSSVPLEFSQEELKVRLDNLNK